jgi:hypothetical protein
VIEQVAIGAILGLARFVAFLVDAVNVIRSIDLIYIPTRKIALGVLVSGVVVLWRVPV